MNIATWILVPWFPPKYGHSAVCLFEPCQQETLAFWYLSHEQIYSAKNNRGLPFQNLCCCFLSWACSIFCHVFMGFSFIISHRPRVEASFMCVTLPCVPSGPGRCLAFIGSPTSSDGWTGDLQTCGVGVDKKGRQSPAEVAPKCQYANGIDSYPNHSSAHGQITEP